MYERIVITKDSYDGTHDLNDLRLLDVLRLPLSLVFNLELAPLQTHAPNPAQRLPVRLTARRVASHCIAPAGTVSNLSKDCYGCGGGGG
eukprot:SAG11_NODE_23622_length_385_cov_1.087413_2_plen_88_part_01